jgi:hypothetical protein
VDIPGKVTMIMRRGELLTHHQAAGAGMSQVEQRL